MVLLARAFAADDSHRCKQDVVFSVANQKAMIFVGGGAENWTQWADFLGLVKDKRIPHAGSPFQVAPAILRACSSIHPVYLSILMSASSPTGYLVLDPVCKNPAQSAIRA